MRQPRRMLKPIMDGDKVVGRAYAAEPARADDVLRDIEVQILPRSPLWTQPRRAQTWGQIEAIFVPSPPVIRCLRPLDVRDGRWELYQQCRYVPIIQEGLVRGTIVASRETTIQQLQMRVDMTAAADRLWRVMALTHNDWCVVSQVLPHDLREDLDELEFLRAQHRGGAKHARDSQRDPKQHMMAWATDKVQRRVPCAVGPTLTMLMKAEARTITALMNSKSETQTKEIISAAYRRAGLTAPFEKKVKKKNMEMVGAIDKNLCDAMMTAMTNQTIITQEIATTMQLIPKTEHYMMPC